MKNILKTSVCVSLIFLIYACNSKKIKTHTIDTLKVGTSLKKSDNKNAKNDSSEISPSTPEIENIYTNLEKITFPRFYSEINDLQVVFGVNGIDISDSTKQKFIFNKNKKDLIINEKADTVSLFINDELDNKLIKITSLEKTNKFKISYCYHYIIEYEKGGAVYITDTTTYKQVKDSVNFFFRLPLFKKLSPINEIKTRLKVTDSVVKVSGGDYGEEKYTAYVVKNKLLVLSAEDLWIKIERFQNNNLQETKIIKFYDFEED